MKRLIELSTQDEILSMNITKSTGRKTGLVLSGGGAKSIFQAQVIRRLRQSGYRFNVIAGISSGALNAAVMSQRDHNLVETWLEASEKDLLRGGFGILRFIKMILGIKNSFYDNDGIEKFLRDNYDPKKTKIPFIVGSVNLQTGEHSEFEIRDEEEFSEFREKEVYKSIVASTAIPLVFPPVSHLGKRKVHMFVDGGLRNISPLRSIVRRDVDEILVITNSPRHLGTTADSLNTPFEIAERSFDILLNEIMREDIDSVLKVNRIISQCDNKIKSSDGYEYRHIDISLIEPRFGLGSMLDFSKEIQEKRIEEANNVCDRMLAK